MTNEEKQLLLKDLCARLPYGVKVQPCGSAFPHKFIGYDKGLARIDTDQRYELDDIKPYLRPMSSMTDEEKMYVNELIYDKNGLFLSPIPTWVINECDIDKYIDFCNSKHLDWCGLISKGLALPAPEDMYNF